MKYHILNNDNLDEIIEIFHHENLKYSSGEYPNSNWLIEFISNGYARGLSIEGKIVAALIAESVIGGGIYLWIIAVRKEDIGKKYGQSLYQYFEKEMKESGKNWIFLTSWYQSENFYKRNGFETTELQVKEMCKDLRK